MLPKEVNNSLYKAAEHLAEAGKYMLIFNKEKALSFMSEADIILSIIEPRKQKVSDEKLDSILDEIGMFGEDS